MYMYIPDVKLCVVCAGTAGLKWQSYVFNMKHNYALYMYIHV